MLQVSAIISLTCSKIRAPNHFVHTQIVEVDLALYHMYILADLGHLPVIDSDGEQFAF